MVQIATRPQARHHSMPVTRVPFVRTQICNEACQAVQQVLASGWVTSGQQVIEFEREFAEHVGARRAVAVS
jgi:dTDP-4-amino-4,6-dideoxygalactose transaminase